LHYTWCYREQNGGFNHDIHYASSTNGGVTWLNNAGAVIANTSLGQTITLNSPGTIIKPVEGTQQMINQQAQCVDGAGRVHVLMSHRRVEPEFEWQLGDSAFGGAETAYYHYFRDPVTRIWSQRQLPTTYAVGSRPKVGYDASANVYAIYNSGSKLIVASASKASSYTDWSIAAVVIGNFSGESLLDQARLKADGILSVYHQENAGSSSLPTNSTLRVIEFVVNVPNPAPVSLSFLGADALVTVAAAPGFSYQLQTRTNLGLGNWENVGGTVAGYAGLLTLPHAGEAIGAQRYYRVVRTP